MHELPPSAPRKPYGQAVPGLSLDGRPLGAGVFDENAVRAGAGLMMALAAGAFAFAYFDKAYLPIRVVTTFFFVEFAIRVHTGVHASPVGLVAQWLTRRQTPKWVSAQPKRFAWTLGLVLAFAMMVLTNAGVHGALPLTLCFACLALMWLEAALGVCLGCEIHGLLLRRGWIARDAAYEICSHGACAIDAQS